MRSDTLSTERLTLRPPLMADAQAVAALANDAEIARWMTQLPHPYTQDDARDFIARQTSGRTFLICLEGAPIGCIGTEGEFGYWLGRAFWGQGYATEASGVVLDWHFENAGDTLRSGHALGNERSRRVLLKLGFRDTDVTSRRHTITGEWRQQQNMELGASTWRAAA